MLDDDDDEIKQSTADISIVTEITMASMDAVTVEIDW